MRERSFVIIDFMEWSVSISNIFKQILNISDSKSNLNIWLSKKKTKYMVMGGDSYSHN